MIEKYCADALRFWAAGSKLGEDLPFQEKDLMTGQKMVTKLFNASKFTIMHLEDYNLEKVELKPMDKWLLSKLNKLVKDSTESFGKYEYARTKADTEKFFWQTLCDNYLEIAKDRLYNPDVRGDDTRKSAQYALYTSALSVLKLMAPIMPHITESVYQMYFAAKEGKKSIHISSWPEFDKKMINAEIDETGDVAVDVIAAVRRYKSENQISLKESLKKVIIKCEDKKHEKMIEAVMDDLKATTKAEAIEFGNKVSIPCDNFVIEIGVER
jgi:valyl-tRNA synthetase